MKILIVTYGIRNNWTGGVHKYFHSIAPILKKNGHEVYFFDGDNIIKSQPDVLEGIRFVTRGIASKNEFEKFFLKTRPEALHIQAEFSVGVAARNFCMDEGIPFTTAYHTNFDKVIKDYHAPTGWVWPYLKWFHKSSSIIHTLTPRLKRLLQDKGVNKTVAVFPPGVSRKEFYYEKGTTFLKGHPRPYFVTMSRISKEKNIEAFLKLDLPGTKFVIGDGPYKSYLMRKYGKSAIFLPYVKVRECLSESDVFVWPSKFDTFGLGILEAMASGLPVAAYPVMGPQDILEEGVTGSMSEDLQKAALACLSLKKDACIEAASHYTWEKTADNFLNHQVVIQ
jgi:glycosyltransferase involved in cell wall biosynthesis